MIEVIATLTGVLGGVIGTFLAIRGHMRQVRQDYEKRLAKEMERHSDAKVKEYAAQRDFEHLRRHHEQLKDAVNRIDTELEEVKDTLLELRVMSKGAFNRIEQIVARIDGANTGGTPRQQ
ncbi:hypothetical protein P7L53_00485 [Thermoleptolyngbya sichuanensis XZ-Cy5]|uniref:hypothetical protein n=1 Tax=Thermoleptolyngbya sichuanensis TaxID=2885951 RepID=UPI00240DFEA9|nr:hypothetical protein [Thermoleptolyngbya sichuanensis]MDG2614708.1 hypothetical protein [Thermoleptolyngbya sichuanensis XZ-Cy5]